MNLEVVERHRCFGGEQFLLRHRSAATGTDMNVAVFVPPGEGPFPALLYLSGLTCTEQNAVHKAGFQRAAATAGMVVVCPDTSPRGEGVPDVPEWDLGIGAGFYVDATEPPWSTHFQMYSYVRDELPVVVSAHVDVEERWGITGHSMGGLGALVLGLRNPDRFRSISALSPISHPPACPWGRKALTAYLGPDEAAWAEHDPCHLLRTRDWRGIVLVDQGEADPFLIEQLRPDDLKRAALDGAVPMRMRRHPGYDHSYYFVASFMADHVAHHAR